MQAKLNSSTQSQCSICPQGINLGLEELANWRNSFQAFKHLKISKENVLAQELGLIKTSIDV